MKKKVLRWSVLVGVLILAFLIYRIGPQRIWDNIKLLTWQSIFILMGLRLFYWLLRTINWKIVFEAYEGSVSLFHLFGARLCSHSVAQLTPSAQVGGEATRIFLVPCSDRKVSLASVIVDKTIEFLTVIIFTMFGVAIAVSRIAFPVKLQVFFIGFVVVGAGLLLLMISKQKNGLLEWFVGLLARVRIRPKFIRKNMEKIRETDRYISDFYTNHRKVFLKAFLSYALMMLLWTVEIHLTLVFLGVTDISFIDSFIITALGNLAFIFPVTPGGLGIYEITYVGLFAALGLGTDTGISLVLLRRVLALLWAGIGLFGLLSPRSGLRKEHLENETGG